VGGNPLGFVDPLGLLTVREAEAQLRRWLVLMNMMSRTPSKVSIGGPYSDFGKEYAGTVCCDPSLPKDDGEACNVSVNVFEGTSTNIDLPPANQLCSSGEGLPEMLCHIHVATAPRFGDDDIRWFERNRRWVNRFQVITRDNPDNFVQLPAPEQK
jgi:hypothetical protein